MWYCAIVKIEQCFQVKIYKLNETAENAGKAYITFSLRPTEPKSPKETLRQMMLQQISGNYEASLKHSILNYLIKVHFSLKTKKKPIFLKI